MKLAYVFPGQGAQYVGMGRELMDRYPVARDTVAAADEALGFSLSKLFLEGPEEDLRLTYHTQPALLTVSVAAWRVFQSLQPACQPAAVAGHSLGEYTALVAAGAMSFEDAVRLVHHRGKLMDEAVPAGQGAMSAVLGMAADALEQVCAEASTDGEVVELANLNCPGQIVISGSAKAVERAGQLAKERGARRVMPLVVSGPFHCSLMRPAAGQLSAALAAATLQSAAAPVVANVDAVPRTQPDDLRAALEQQLYSPVRWEADVRAMLDLGVEGFVEFGPGTVLSGLIKKVDRSVVTYHVEDESSLQEALQATAH
ncbi:ACP S-malonyltransferase [Alicyclobacillus cycloheptanicus]|uniref:Malonyl CoA-acyl carrier protein transacylase n=2 Tax=Alicyclobacillus cycloheptanicus TaxID=1457 RepID=A0ABT9XLH0_9BACL|nr:ACP S-malonyltransferase [Alicyclobacillus cycloheptanicus]MDQ0190864.1 [acyl-carrier-protein] S-malonyltransferase [Alicyclobacillus cycloheptanicus]